MKTAETKTSRLQQIESLLLAQPGGLTAAELARRLGVHRSTVGRYLPDLPGHFYLDGERWCIDRQAYLVNVRLTLHEAAAVHLASRLLATCLDRRNPHAGSALRKLGLALEKLAPHFSRHLAQSAEAMENGLQVDDPAYLQALETLTVAWAEGRRVHIWYKSKRQAEDDERSEIHEYLFSPYFIEAYAAGRCAHVIGWRDPPSALRTFKIERIARIEITRTGYEIPAEFDPMEVFSGAWGIWFGEGQPVEVELKFSPGAAGRVGETRWHRSEQTSLLEDGSLLWRVKVDEPQEMMPWIRSWGAEVEVMGPGWLRERLAAEAGRMVGVYGGGSG